MRDDCDPQTYLSTYAEIIKYFNFDCGAETLELIFLELHYFAAAKSPCLVKDFAMEIFNQLQRNNMIYTSTRESNIRFVMFFDCILYRNFDMNYSDIVFSLKEERICPIDEWIDELIGIQAERVRDVNVLDMIENIDCKTIELEILTLRTGISNNTDKKPAAKKRKLSIF